MNRPHPALTFLLSWLLLAGAALAQGFTREQFRAEFAKGLEYNDEKLMDRAIKKDDGPTHAWQYFEELYVEKWQGTGANDDKRVAEREAKLKALQAAWKRCFEGSGTLEKVQRWIDGMDNSVYQRLQAGRNTSAKVWAHAQTVMQAQVKGEYEQVMKQFMDLARNAETIGHALEAADLWGLAGTIGNRMPDKTVEDRENILFLTQQFLLQRDAWSYTGDKWYAISNEFAKSEKVRIEDAKKSADKRAAAGYDANAKGIDALVMPGVAEAKQPLEFEAQKGWDAELDYGPKNGPSPALWWNVSVKGDGSYAQLNWFRRLPLYLVRQGNTKFAVGADPADASRLTEVDVSSKGKLSTFFLDAEKKQPYAMFFWAGSDRERVGEAECNLAFTTDMANVYFRSAASWKATVGADPMVFYDDNANGLPGDADALDPPFKVHTQGVHSGDGSDAPLLDSMRIGKGPRVPFSEFVKLSTGWHYIRRDGNEVLGVRPLNPEYVKTGKVKLEWAGPKTGAPTQLVIRGSGDYKSAYFDVAGGKEVEVPCGEYAVIFGRIVAGKGARAQTATIYRGSAATFAVEPGATHVLKMGAPYEIEFARKGDQDAVIDALSIHLKEASGCMITEFQNGISLVPEVFAAKAEDGKGAKPVGKFVRFTDGDLLNEAAKKHGSLGLLCATFPMPAGYRSGDLVLEIKLPEAGMKVGLKVKKHPLFGQLDSAWK
jgi:hypothetical protein